jgi:hypothetical protein
MERSLLKSVIFKSPLLNENSEEHIGCTWTLCPQTLIKVAPERESLIIAVNATNDSSPQ